MKTVNILNLQQMKRYVKHGAKPIDISYDNERDRIVFTFSKDETQELYKLWNQHELD